MIRSELEGDSYRAYRDIGALSVVVASDARQQDGTVTINIELEREVDRIPPSVLRKVAEHDFGVRDIDHGDTLLAVLVAHVGGGSR